MKMINLFVSSNQGRLGATTYLRFLRLKDRNLIVANVSSPDPAKVSVPGSGMTVAVKLPLSRNQPVSPVAAAPKDQLVQYFPVFLGRFTTTSWTKFPLVVRPKQRWA
jgi:hypothetical protein